jgi:hypothetical protein
MPYAARPMENESGDEINDGVYSEDGEWIVPSNYAQGPWNPDHQNGGAVAGILARAVDIQESPSPMRIARLTIDLMRPVPMRPLKCRAKIVRGGRRIQVVDAWLEDEGVPVARTSALRIRSDSALAQDAGFADETPPPPRPPVEPGVRATRRKISYLPGWLRAVNYQKTGLAQPGEEGRCWVRLQRPMVSGEPNQPVVRLAAISDFSSGVANALDLGRWVSPNADLSLNILREPEGDWFCIEGRTDISNDGVGQSSARIYDDRGPCARGSATLLVDRIPGQRE